MSTSPQFTHEQATKLLDLLSSDDAFREQFTIDPVSSLRCLDIHCEDDSLPCSTVDILASKEEIAQAREKLIAYLLSPVHMRPPSVFESGKVQNALDSI